MRVLFARDHATVYPGKGIFLAGPTPPDSEMENSWRRKTITLLESSHELDDQVIVVTPEPSSGDWQSILTSPSTRFAETDNDQIAWELQYLNLCDVTAFWLPVYWDEQTAGNFPANIGPTTRWEFGMMVERYLSNRGQRKLIVGSPEDAQNVRWARHIARHHNIEWHDLPCSRKEELIPKSFLDAIAASVSTN